MICYRNSDTGVRVAGPLVAPGPVVIAAARIVLAASGVIAASFALLPAAVVVLLALTDAGVHALLGLSGAFLATAEAWLPSLGAGATLPAYRSLPLAIAATFGASLVRAAPPAAIVLLAVAPQTRRVRVLAVVAAIAAMTVAGSVLLALIILPGLLASLLLLADRRDRT